MIEAKCIYNMHTIQEKFFSVATFEGLKDADRARSGTQNLWDASDFSGAQILLCKKEKIIRSTNLQSNR